VQHSRPPLRSAFPPPGARLQSRTTRLRSRRRVVPVCAAAISSMSSRYYAPCLTPGRGVMWGTFRRWANREGSRAVSIWGQLRGMSVKPGRFAYDGPRQVRVGRAGPPGHPQSPEVSVAPSDGTASTSPGPGTQGGDRDTSTEVGYDLVRPPRTTSCPGLSVRRLVPGHRAASILACLESNRLAAPRPPGVSSGGRRHPLAWQSARRIAHGFYYLASACPEIPRGGIG